MDTLILITNSNKIEGAYRRYCSHKQNLQLKCLHPSTPKHASDPIWLKKTYHNISDRLEGVATDTENGLRGVLGVLDLNLFNYPQYDDHSLLPSPIRPLSLNLLEVGSSSWEVVVGMLILAFPEVHWIFPCAGSSVAEESISQSLFTEAHLPTRHSLGEIIRLHDEGFCPLYDPTGLRNHLRTIMNRDASVEEGSMPTRSKTAVSIDDEIAYADFNAYVAYRFGFRGWSVSSWSLLRRLFEGKGETDKEESSEDPGGTWAESVDLSFEDLYCPFPDRPYYVSLSDLDKRKDWLPAIEGIDTRAIITVGHHRDDDGKERWHSNERYLREWQEEREERMATIVRKPLSGIFDLWGKAGLWEWDVLSWNGQPKAADGFRWPPDHDQEGESSGGHSAPGRLLLIAERLIKRSKAVLKEAQSVSEATYAATLALEAKELIGNRTPTTSLEALALQHRAEVIAEGMFHGIEFHLDVENRFEDLKQEVEAIGRWFSGTRRKRVTLNARLAIIEDLAREFSRLDQFEEERACRAEARRLYFDFWAYQSPWRLPLLPVLRYLSFSLKSLPVFLGLVVFWILLFGIGYHFLDPVVHVKDLRGFGNAFSSSMVYFLTLAPPDPYWGEGVHRKVLWNSVTAFQSFISLSHLGLLVSHIYLIVSRR